MSLHSKIPPKNDERNERNDLNLNDEVWFIPRGAALIVKCKIDEIDDHARKRDPQAYLFYWLDEPVGHGLDRDDVFVGTKKEAIACLQEYIQDIKDDPDEDITRYQTDLETWRRTASEFIISTHGKQGKKEKYGKYPFKYTPKTYGTEWFNDKNAN